mgnify:CR=1 FL=1
MEIERALQQLELLQKKLYAYHCADSSLYLDAVTTAPSDTSEGRGVAMSILAGESQKLAVQEGYPRRPESGIHRFQVDGNVRICVRCAVLVRE